jgi:hypothetical protein
LIGTVKKKSKRNAKLPAAEWAAKTLLIVRK